MFHDRSLERKCHQMSSYAIFCRKTSGFTNIQEIAVQNLVKPSLCRANKQLALPFSKPRQQRGRSAYIRQRLSSSKAAQRFCAVRRIQYRPSCCWTISACFWRTGSRAPISTASYAGPQQAAQSKQSGSFSHSSQPCCAAETRCCPAIVQRQTFGPGPE